MHRFGNYASKLKVACTKKLRVDLIYGMPAAIRFRILRLLVCYVQSYRLKYLIISLWRFGLFSGHGLPGNRGSRQLSFRRRTQLHAQPPASSRASVSPALRPKPVWHGRPYKQKIKLNSTIICLLCCVGVRFGLSNQWHRLKVCRRQDPEEDVWI